MPPSATVTVRVRPMTAADLPAVERLSAELGYPVTVSELAERFARLGSSASDALFVAERGGDVLGWVHVQQRVGLESAPSAELMALVVSTATRRSGAGRALVAACVEWARRLGLRRVRVRSNVAREESHRFYPALGFARVKTQHVYDLSHPE